MVVMLCRNRVADYEKWKRVFDANTPAARDAGLRLMNLWRDTTEPNNVFFMFEVADTGKARAFISDPAAAESGKTSGVLDGECHFLESSPGPEERVDPVVLRRFESPDEARRFDKGIFELVRMGDMTVGRARYEPGWRWSKHVAPVSGTRSCQVSHLGLVVSGRAKVLMDGGREETLAPGDLFAIAPGHDSWVVGSEPYVSLHFMGADSYAKGDR